MKINTSELTDSALDWAVAKCEGLIGGPYIYKDYKGDVYCEGVLPDGVIDAPESAFDIKINGLGYSTNWARGGPIIEREKISVEVLGEGDGWQALIGCTPNQFLLWDQPYNSDASYGEGETVLIAAMRCYVASKLGNEVEVPDELL